MSGIIDIHPEILREKHRLSPRQINTIVGGSLLPDEIDDKLHGFELVKEFISVCDKLKSRKIDLVPLKGPVLSHRLYGDAVMRNYFDLDLLIRVRDITATVSLLKESGYRSIFIVWPESGSAQRKLIGYINHVALINPDNKIALEIHWRLIEAPPISMQSFDNLVNQNLTTIDFAGKQYSVLNNELELLYLIIHGGLHFWARLKWLVDVDMFLKTQAIDWDRFRKLAAEMKANRMVALCNEIYSKYFPNEAGMPFNFKVPGRLVRHSLNRIEQDDESFLRSLKSVLNNFYFILIAFPGIRYKTRHIYSFFFKSIYSGRTRSLMRLPLMIYRRCLQRNGYVPL
jgi:hypothetical protein